MSMVINTSLEQYTCFNYPVIELDNLKSWQVKSIKEYSRLYEQYQGGRNKKEVLIKKVCTMETYALYSTGEFVVLATIAHNRTNRDTKDICQGVIDDIRFEENSCFIL